MKCPVCNSVDLLLAERQGIEIDYCPTCRGVWLDRGELDKIIERASQPQVQTAVNPGVRHDQYSGQGQTHHHHAPHGYGHGHPYKKKKSLLSEIFDFD